MYDLAVPTRIFRTVLNWKLMLSHWSLKRNSCVLAVHGKVMVWTLPMIEFCEVPILHFSVSKFMLELSNMPFTFRCISFCNLAFAGQVHIGFAVNVDVWDYFSAVSALSHFEYFFRQKLTESWFLWKRKRTQTSSHPSCLRATSQQPAFMGEWVGNSNWLLRSKLKRKKPPKQAYWCSLIVDLS